MTTRTTKQSPNAESTQLSHLESLLLAQAAWESGTRPSAWTTIAKILSKHPLVTRPKSFFTAHSCQSMYENLLHEASLKSNEESSSIRSPTNLALAQKHFQLRYNELRELIVVEENAFKTILKEIEEIKSGKWDAKIQAKLTGQVLPEKKWPVNILAPSSEPLDPNNVSDTSSSTLVKNAASENSTATNTVENTASLRIDSQSATDLTQIVSSNTGMEVDLNPESSVGVKAEETNDSQTTSTQNNDQGSIQLRREEEEEEEDISASKSEEEETDREDQIDEAENAAAERAVVEELTKSPDHKAEGEDIEMNHEDQPEVQDESENVQEPTVEEACSDEEHPHTATRRSTRNQRPSVSSGPIVGIRKSRRQQRRPELDAQSPVATETEPNGEEETKAETPQLEDDLLSSPAPVDPVGARRRKRKSSLVENVESPRDRKRQREESEPVDDDEPGPSSGGLRGKRRGDRSEEQLALKRFQNVISMLHSQISQHRNGNIFHNPIRTVEAPDYHDIVKRPMDLRTIKTRVKDGLITNSLEYQRDIYLMFANAMMYNRPGSDVYHMAEDMMHESEGYIMTFRQTEGLVRGRP